MVFIEFMQQKPLCEANSPNAMVEAQDCFRESHPRWTRTTPTTVGKPLGAFVVYQEVHHSDMQLPVFLGCGLDLHANADLLFDTVGIQEYHFGG